METKYTLKELQTLLEKINPKVDWDRILMGYPEILTKDQVVHYLLTNVLIPKELSHWGFTEFEIAVLRLVIKTLN